MTPFRFVLIALATFRLAHMVAMEDGPEDAFTKLRTAVKDRYGDESWQFKGVCCPCCLSFWFVWPVMLIASLEGAAGVLLVGLAASAVTVAITDATDDE